MEEMISGGSYLAESGLYIEANAMNGDIVEFKSTEY